ncbi:MAG: hypothetical protein ACI87E_001205 [Mariniblastus sp.]|jgi:hypothetical protein
MSRLSCLLVTAIGCATVISTAHSQEIDFQRDIAPILESRCWDCHGEDEEAGLRLDLRANSLLGGDSGLAAIVPGKPEKSLLIEVINHVDEDLSMPPDEDKIPAKEIELLTRWIQAGANWPGQMDAVAEKKASDHWSFQPVVRPEIPRSNQESSNPIDAFLARKLRSQGLKFSKAADPTTLIRRVSIVLTGIAPTIDQTDRFLEQYEQDASGGVVAYEQLVDRLLESPHFGERWAQHWLDVIRWAETNGSESNMYRKNAWVYRDYVIGAFNQDKPYDQFLIEQIAGDSVGQGEATGYLVSGSHVPAATVGSEPSAQRQARADRMDEILQTIGASALGVTVGCARCHNHKFDPISISDYYAMSAVFQDVEFGSRFPELAEDHPRSKRADALIQKKSQIEKQLATHGPWIENWHGFQELRLPVVKTKKIRFMFEKQFIRLDEIEIFGPETADKNLALATHGTTAFTPPEMELPNGSADKVNDGERGVKGFKARSNKGSSEKPRVELTFTHEVQIDRIKLSTNLEDYYETDYLTETNQTELGIYRVDAQDAEGEWQEIVSVAKLRNSLKRNREQAKLNQELKVVIGQLAAEGPQPAFVGKFIEPTKTHIMGRGSPENLRDEVFPAGLEQLDGDLQIDPYAPGHVRRKAFADWIVRPSHPLTARVAVNRFWHHVFGSGLVVTTSDFGAAGTLPSHPELLDWLAAELIEPTSQTAALTPSETHGWSMKHIIKLLVMSEAFRQSSLPNEHALKVDASAATLWRFPPKRVEAEVIRDSILQASGELDRSIGGTGFRIHNVKKRYAQWQVVDNHGENTWRRMIYQERMRRVDDHLFTAFDFPDCGQVRAKRPISTTPLQALNLMNSDFVIEQSKLIAKRAQRESNADVATSVDRCFQLLLGRAPAEDERTACVAMANQNNLSLVCRVLINSNEFAFLP